VAVEVTAKNLTKAEAIAAFNQIAGARLAVAVLTNKLSAEEAEYLRENFNKQMADLTSFSSMSSIMAPLAPGATADPGCCTHTVDGTVVMTDGICEHECWTVLHGMDWHAGRCLPGPAVG
jgi:hypothetical protein